MNRTGFSQVGIPYKNFSEFIPQHDSDPHILSLCQHILLSVEISESGRQPESRIPRKSNESRTSYTRIPACGTPYFTDDNKESEQKTKINTRFKRYLNIFAEDRIRLGKPGTSSRFLPAFTIFAQHGKPVAAKSILHPAFIVFVHNNRLKSDGLP
jgi:hypothetical protein